MQFPDSEKDDPNRVLNIVQPDGSNIPFVQAPNKVKRMAYDGSIACSVFCKWTARRKPFKLQEMEKIEAGKIIEQKVLLGPNKT